MANKRDRLKAPEIDYIRSNCLSTSDEKMAAYLKRDLRTVRAARRKLGITKVSGGKLQNVNLGIADVNSIVLQASQKLTEEQRKEFFKTQLTNTLYYNKLKEQFSSDEIDFYLEEWGALCVQFEDIVATEKRQIDELIKVSILGSRILRNIKIAEDEIETLQKEVEEAQEEEDVEDNQGLQERINAIALLLRSMTGQSRAMTIDYQNNIEMKNKLLTELNARRKDRVDQLTKRGTTFLGLVTAFADKEVRENQGRNMELMRMAKEKKKAEWRKPITFPDGTQDCILMDDNSTLPKTEVVMLSSVRSEIVEEYRYKQDINILIVDDDMRRMQFFSELFGGNKLDFASNSDKAFECLGERKYDLICLDFDLGLGQKGILVANKIIDENILPETPILIHSMNKKGAVDIYSKLKTSRRVEVIPFESLIKSIGEKNAKISK